MDKQLLSSSLGMNNFPLGSGQLPIVLHLMSGPCVISFTHISMSLGTVIIYVLFNKSYFRSFMTVLFMKVAVN